MVLNKGQSAYYQKTNENPSPRHEDEMMPGDETVQEWHRDQRLEQQVSGDNPPMNPELFRSLASRVKALEASMDDWSPAQVPHQTDLHPDAKADRLVSMLDTIDLLEKKLHAGSFQPTRSDYRDAYAANEQRQSDMHGQFNRIKQLEQQLDLIDAQLKQTSSISGVRSQSTSRNFRDEHRGRRHLDEAVTMAAAREEPGTSDGDWSRSARATRLERNHQETDRQFKLLQNKIDDLRNGTPDRHALEVLRIDFAELKRDLLGDKNQSTHDLNQTLTQLHTEISNLASTKTPFIDPDKLDGIETDMNRVAEYLLTSPDLSGVPEQVTALSREVSRLSDGLLAAMGKTETAAQKSSETIGKKLDASLRGLKSEILLQVQNVLAEVDTTGSVLPHVDRQLQNLHREITGRTDKLETHIASSTDDLRDKISRVESYIASAAQRVKEQAKAEGAEASDKKLAAMEERLFAAVKRLEDRHQQTLERLGEVSGSVAQIPEDVVTSETLSAALERAVGRLESSQQQTMEQLGGVSNALIKIPNDALTSEKLNTELEQALLNLQAKHDAIRSDIATALESQNQQIDKLVEAGPSLRAGLEESVASLRDELLQRQEQLLSQISAMPTLTRADLHEVIPDDLPSEATLISAIEQLGSLLDDKQSDLLAQLQSLLQSNDETKAGVATETLLNDAVQQNFDRLSKEIQARQSELLAQIPKVQEKKTTPVSEMGLDAANAEVTAALVVEQVGATLEDKQIALLSRMEELLQVQRLGEETSGKTTTSSISLTSEDLKEELEALSAVLENQQGDLLGRVDTAINKLGQLAQDQTAAIKEVVRVTTEETLQQSTPSENTEQSGGAQINLDGLQNDLQDLKNTSGQLSRETRDAFNSVNATLERVATRLDKLETSKDEPIAKIVEEDQPAEVDEVDKKPLALTSDMRSGEEEGTQVWSAKREQDLIRRMRDHAKHVEAEAGDLEPGAEDQPLTPGSGEPQLATVDDPVALADTHRSSLDSWKSEPEEDEVEVAPKSKADFIAAARRAAQIAAAEHDNQQQAMEHDQEENEKRFFLVRFLPSFSRKKKQEDELVLSGDAPVDAEMTEDFSNTDFREFTDAEEKQPEAIGEAADDYDLRMLAAAEEAEETRSNKRVWLRVVLIIAIIGVLGLYQKQALTNLFAPILGPVFQTLQGDVSPSQSNVEVQSETPVSDDNALDDGPQTDATSSALSEAGAADGIVDAETREAASESLLDDNGIDGSIVESIQPRAIIAEPAGSETPSIFSALSKLPKDETSERLSNGLLAEDPAAFFELGRRFSEGDTLERDLTQAAFWYEKAALANFAVAQYRLGTLYQDGIGVTRNLTNARQWYVRAAENGNARAMHNLAVLYADGAFGQPDFHNAFRWFSKAAELGIADSQYNLAILYVRGLGVDADLVEAYKWFDITARSGDQDAVNKRDEIAKALNEEQLDAARQAGKQWQKKPWNNEANIVTKTAQYWKDQASNLTTPAEQSLIREAQVILNELGFDAGSADGVIGQNTEKAIRAFQNEIGVPQDGRVDYNLIQLLKAQRI